MKRVGFVLKVKADKIEEYKQHHTQVWPEMLDALRDAGWHNYSLFLREDGLLFGYFETPVDLATAQQAMAETEVNTRWQTFMDLCAERNLIPILRLATVYDRERRLWEAPPLAADDTWTRRALAHRDDHLDGLRSMALYRQRDRYRRAVKDINRVTFGHLAFSRRQDVGGAAGSR